MSQIIKALEEIIAGLYEDLDPIYRENSITVKESDKLEDQKNYQSLVALFPSYDKAKELKKYLTEGGLYFIVSMLAGSLHELASSMMELDLANNTFTERLKPLPSEEKLLSLARTGLNSPVLLLDELELSYKDLQSLLYDLQGIRQGNPSPVPYPGKDYWINLEKIYRLNFDMKATIKIGIIMARV